MRSAGILLPIFSLPGKYGIGCFSKEAYRFVDILKEAHQTYWQILPLGPTGYGDSPYQTFSTFAGNPYFISLEALIEEGLLSARECARLERGVDPKYIDYGRLYNERFAVLKKAYERWDPKKDTAYASFVKENSDWLEDYALFMAVKGHFKGVSFTLWDEDIRYRKKQALSKYKKLLAGEIGFHKFLQHKFYQQWKALRAYANEKGIRIIGDIPIYVSPDSSDLWAFPELFQVDKKRNLSAVAGCPPDAFCADGQLWGNPLYDWEYHKSTGFAWWVSRVRKMSELYDVVRIDHFRGFDEYYSIPAGSKTARNGEWEKGPGWDLFKVIREKLGKFDIIAEDLGFITPSVRALVKKTGYCNMKVLEFAFDPDDTHGKNEYLPHNYGPCCVVYTGTHDNETVAGWFSSMKKKDRDRALSHLGLSTKKPSIVTEALVRQALSSVASYCIIPIQDYLCLGNEARINHPSTLGGNWVWRLVPGQLEGQAERIAKLTDLYNRATEKK